MTVTTLIANSTISKRSLEEHDGMGAFVVLVGADGILQSKLVDGKYGKVWLLNDEDAAVYGRKFIPFDGSHVNDPEQKRSKVQDELGLQQMIEVVPAFCSRNGDICRKGEWPPYGFVFGIPYWDENYEIWEE